MTHRIWTRTMLLLPAVLAAAALLALTARAQQFSPWSAPVNLNDITGCPAVVNSTSPDANDTHPALSNDGLSLYFGSTRPGGFPGDYDLWFTHRDSLDSCWGLPKNVAAVNSPQQDFAPNLTPDGHWLYFHSNRPGGCGGADLYASHRDNTSDDLGWENPIDLGCTINTNTPPVNPVNHSCVINPSNTLTLGQAGPTYFNDVATGKHYLYYTQRATGQSEACFDIYVSICTVDLASCNTQGLWGPGTPVDALNSPGRDTRTAIRRDGLEMIISSNRLGSLASENLWVSTRPAVTSDQLNWTPPEPINCDDNTTFTSPDTGISVPVPCLPWNPQGPLVNSAAFDGGPALSSDGTELYFFRVVPANNMLTNCTVPPGPEFDTSPYCRDLFVSKRTYITNTALSSSANPSIFGQSVTFTATVSAAWDLATTPTGTVTFSDGATSLGTGALASGDATLTTSSLAVGSHSITGQYGGDRISSGSSGSLTQTVEYGICALYDQTRSVHSGATFPIKIQLCDANGNDLSSSAIIVHATSVSAVSGFSGTPDSPGNANPDNDFRFDATLGSTGGCIFNLSTGGLTPGTYSLQFIAGSDPVTHSVNFGVN